MNKWLPIRVKHQFVEIFEPYNIEYQNNQAFRNAHFSIFLNNEIEEGIAFSEHIFQCHLHL